jgi:N-acetylgalactosamine 4-sulfate 6-O-sulfotransferase
LQDWLRHWPRQQLLILRYEDYIAAVPQHLKAVLTFLDLPEPEAATFGAMAAAEPQNKKAYPLIRADTRQQLEVFYAPFNAALTKMLGDARWQWADVEGQGQGLSASPHAAATPG